MRSGFWLIFISIVVALLAMQFYLARSVNQWLLTLPLSPSLRVWIPRILLALLIYFNLSIPARVLIRSFNQTNLAWLKSLVIFPGTTWLITMLMMFALFVMKDVAGWVYGLFQKDTVDLSKRAFLQAAGAVSFTAPLILSGYGALRTARNYKVKHVELKYPNLPRAFDGFTIAQISDIHAGIYMNEKEMVRIREMIDAERPQVTVITGDFVDTRASEIEPVARVFSKTRTEFGIFGCMGNHDVFDDYRALSKTMKDSGIIMLENGNHRIKVNGDAIGLLGVNDSGRRYNLADLKEAAAGIEEGMFKILLAHRPEFFPKAKSENIDLQLSGHTHGGQIGLNIAGFPLNLVHLFHDYPQGLFEENRSKLYVNPGVGMVFAPIRIGIDPEITLITLRSVS